MYDRVRRLSQVWTPISSRQFYCTVIRESEKGGGMAFHLEDEGMFVHRQDPVKCYLACSQCAR